MTTPSNEPVSVAPAGNAVTDQGADASRLIAMGYGHLQWERHDEALKSFFEALDRDPGNRQARFAVGTVYAKQEKYREAMSTYEELLAQDASDYMVLNNLAWLFATAKDPSIRDLAKAVALAQQALLVAPADFHVWSTLAEAHYIAGNYDKALKAAEEALSLSRRNPSASADIKLYSVQVEKCRRAAVAMTLIE